MYNRLLDECGDSDIKNSKQSFVDPALKFFPNIPLMMNTNERINEKLANGTLCRGLYVKIKKGYHFVKENWEGYMVNTISVNHIKHIVCTIDDNIETDQRYFIVKPESTLCTVQLHEWNNMTLEKIKITYLPLNSSISTTGHKLQGQTLNHLVINSWGYKCPHWIYVVLSRVTKLTGLILNQKLDENRSYEANDELIRWERNMKTTIEHTTFKERGDSDYEMYINEESKYSDFYNNTNQEGQDEVIKTKDSIQCQFKKTNLKKKIRIMESRDEKDVIDLNRKELRDETKKQNSEKVQTKLFGTNQTKFFETNQISHILNVKGNYFSFVDVPGDGDCFYHSVLKHPHMTDRFHTVQALRLYLRNSVINSFQSDQFLQRLFQNEQTDFNQWCSTITTLGIWGKTIDKLILSYFTKIAIVTIGNYCSGFWVSDTRVDLNTIYKLQEDLTKFGIIHIYHHKYGCPLERSESSDECNHFAYLKPIDDPNIDVENNSIKAVN